MNFNQLFEDVVQLLNQSVAKNLKYHQTWHTLEVLKNAEDMAIHYQLPEDDVLILKTAALLHDVGYIYSTDHHEAHSIQYANETLPKYGYAPAQIHSITELIKATKLPQKPQNEMSKILCDADLFYFGDQEYEKKSVLLFQELKSLNVLHNEREWITFQLNFLKNHKYHTTYAKEKNDAKKLDLIIKLQQQLSDKTNLREMAYDIVLMLTGTTLAAIALKKFLVPNHFVDGGITGISLLVHELYHLNLAVIIFLFNLPLVLISRYIVGKKFAIKTLISTLVLGVILFFIPAEAVTHDKLLVSLFGGVFLGIGAGLVMRTGAALDGIEVLALYTLRKTSFTIAEIILGINILIFSVAAIYFGLETALYSILTYFAATRTINYVVEGLESYTGVTIISGKSEEIKHQLVHSLGRGITIYKGERGFLPGSFDQSADCDIIFTVITRLELRRLTNLVAAIDPKAFIFANTIKEAAGGVLKKIHKH